MRASERKVSGLQYEQEHGVENKLFLRRVWATAVVDTIYATAFPVHWALRTVWPPYSAEEQVLCLSVSPMPILGGRELRTRNEMPSPSTTVEALATPLVFAPNRPKETYEKDIDACHKYVRMGESHKLCLTNQLEAKVPDSLLTLDLYRIRAQKLLTERWSEILWSVSNSVRQI
jgi:anthranilate/para-aminobenzoate synthase component I